VILVHGARGVATSTIKVADVFRANGYSDEELYATTFGEPTSGKSASLKGKWCNYAEGVRHLIVAVQEYTNSDVNVIAYSFGGQVSRKAIMGGKCTDTKEDLGLPLNGIQVYLSVAGTQRGYYACGVRCEPMCGGAWQNNINSRFLLGVIENQKMIFQSTL
jgi:triacylglycerol esterase/lipase EstA (alpha/beta hydrolase family)